MSEKITESEKQILENMDKILTPQAGCFKCKSIHYHSTWQECSDYNNQALAEKDKTISDQSLTIRKMAVEIEELRKHLSDRVKMTDDFPKMMLDKINAEIEAKKAEVK